MAYFKCSTAGGSSVEIDGVEVDGDLKLVQNGYIDHALTNLPYDFNFASGEVINGEIHIIGGSTSTNSKYHYKYNGSSWKSVSTLPESMYGGSSAILDGVLHIFVNTNPTKHYRYNGSTWTLVCTINSSLCFQSGKSVVLDGEIHLMGGNGSSTNKKHYKYNGSTWTSVSTLPYYFSKGCATVLDNEIHILGGETSGVEKYHYKYNGSTWTSVSTLPVSCSYGSAVIFDEELHILRTTYHYKYNGSTWTSVSTLPFSMNGGEAFSLNNKLYALCGYSMYTIAHPLYEIER